MTSYLDQNGWPLIVILSTGRLGNCLTNYALVVVLQKRFPNATYGVIDNVYESVRTVVAEDTINYPIFSKIYMFSNLKICNKPFFK